jgi:hypothetical protein
LQRTHADALATLPVPEGQAWQAVLALKAENFPAAHATHDVPDIIVPGGQALQVVASPPREYCSGDGHGVHTLALLLYWPAAHDAARTPGVRVVIKNVMRWWWWCIGCLL